MGGINKLIGNRQPGYNGEIRLDCPFENHKSEKPFSVNLENKAALCFACGRGWNFEQLEEELNACDRLQSLEIWEERQRGRNALSSQMAGKSQRSRVSDETDQEFGKSESGITVEDFWRERGYDPETVPCDYGEVRHGDLRYIRIFGNNRDSYQDRTLGPGPKYLTPEGGSGFYYFGDRQSSICAIGEGPLDALGLYSGGFSFTVASLGANGAAQEKLAYELLPPRTVVLCLDNDFAGYQATQKAADTLRTYGHKVLLLDIPEPFKDPAEIWANDRDKAIDWIEGFLDAIAKTGDSTYLETMFSGEFKELETFSTGLEQLDGLLKGGYRPGIHLVAAEPKAGKSAFIQHLARLWASQGYKVLQHSTELPKRQIWARIASPYLERDWWEIEQNPEIVKDDERLAHVLSLSENLRVLVSTSIDEMVVAAEDCDIILLDYLQALNEVQDDPRLAINKLIRVLTKLSIEDGKLLVVVSELGRHAYRRDKDGIKPPISPDSFKETGRIEYAIQSALSLIRGEGSELIQMHLMLNTRGQPGKFYVRGHLENNTFEDHYI